MVIESNGENCDFSVKDVDSNHEQIMWNMGIQDVLNDKHRDLIQNTSMRISPTKIGFDQQKCGENNNIGSCFWGTERPPMQM